MATGYYEHPEIKQRAESLMRNVRRIIQTQGHEVDADLRKIDDIYMFFGIGEVGAHPLGFLSERRGREAYGGKNRLYVSYLTHIKAPNSPEGYKKTTLQDNKKRKLTAKEIAEAVLAAYRAKAAVERDSKKAERTRDKADAVAKRLTRGYKDQDDNEIHVKVRAFTTSPYGRGGNYAKTKRQGIERQEYNIVIDGLTEDEAALVIERLPKTLKGLGK